MKSHMAALFAFCGCGTKPSRALDDVVLLRPNATAGLRGVFVAGACFPPRHVLMNVCVVQ